LKIKIQYNKIKVMGKGDRRRSLKTLRHRRHRKKHEREKRKRESRNLNISEKEEV
jgi:hypothetical protein